MQSSKKEAETTGFEISGKERQSGSGDPKRKSSDISRKSFKWKSFFFRLQKSSKMADKLEEKLLKLFDFDQIEFVQKQQPMPSEPIESNSTKIEAIQQEPKMKQKVPKIIEFSEPVAQQQGSKHDKRSFMVIK